MTYTINSAETENVGSLMLAIIELDITNYDVGGEDVSKSALGLPSEPVGLWAASDENHHAFTWDESGGLLLVQDGAAEVADTTDVGVVKVYALHRGL